MYRAAFAGISLADVDGMKVVTDILADRWPGSLAGRNGVRASAAIGVSQWAASRSKSRILKHATITSSVKAQPVVGRLENLQSQVTRLASKQEQG